MQPERPFEFRLFIRIFFSEPWNLFSPHKSDVIIATFDFALGYPQFNKNDVKLINGIPASFVSKRFVEKDIKISLNFDVGQTTISMDKIALVQPYVNEQFFMNPYAAVRILIIDCAFYGDYENCHVSLVYRDILSALNAL